MSTLSTPLILKIDDWPDPDRCLWLRQFEASGFFGDGGTLAHWAPPTQRVGLERYGQWLSYLVRKHPQLLELSPAERITEDTVGSYISDCEDRGLSVVTTFGLPFPASILVTVIQKHAPRL